MAPASPLLDLAHRPYPLPTGPWLMRQRWNDLLFAHWPIPAAELTSLLPPTLRTGLEIDTHDGHAWIGVVPFWMSEVTERLPHLPPLQVPTVRTFSELNLRTYVRSRRTGLRGVYFFSLDCSSPLAVLGARVLFHLPYFVASMHRTQHPPSTHGNQDTPLIDYRSHRLLTSPAPSFQAAYAPTGPVTYSQPHTLEHFLTERYCLFTHARGRILRGDIHHHPWPLQPAQAEIPLNEIPAAHGITLPPVAPILHFSRSLEVYIWPLHPEA